MSRKNYTDKILEAARKGEFELPLSKPLISGTKTFETLNLDLNKLTAQDTVECEEQWAAQYGRTAQSASYSATYRMIVASRALEIPVEDLIRGLTLKDGMAVSNCVISFLIA